MFQSLFSWNLLLMDKAEEDRLGDLVSFNPCFRGTCSWWARKLRMHDLHSMFQSLFSWNLLLMLRRGCNMLQVTGFNPCFRGTCSWCRDRLTNSLIIFSFQSLFSWNLLLMGVGCSSRTFIHRVSILVFVELALDGWYHGLASRKLVEFQSLFSWNLLLMTRSFFYLNFKY